MNEDAVRAIFANADTQIAIEIFEDAAFDLAAGCELSIVLDKDAAFLVSAKGEDMLGLSTCWFQIPDERTVCRFDRFLKKACVPRFKTHGYAERDEVLAVLGSCHCSDVFCTPTICS